MTGETMTKIPTNRTMRDPYPKVRFDKIHAEKPCTFKKNEWTKCSGTMNLMSVAGDMGVHERWFCNQCVLSEAVSKKDYLEIYNIKAPARNRRER